MINSQRKPLRRILSFSYIVLFGVAFSYAPGWAQTLSPPSPDISARSSDVAQSPLRFEVASIRRRDASSSEPSNRQILPGGRFIATATTVRTLIRIAFGADDNMISGAPGWIDSETFDINATIANHAEVTNPKQFQQAILSLLQDRFAFRFHLEQKPTTVYWLELTKPGELGPSLKPGGAEGQPNMSTNANGSRAEMKAIRMSMQDTAAALSRQAGRPVEDHTGLQGTFDFQIEWSSAQSSDSALPSLFTVLKEDLGLKLQPAKGTAQMVVIDQVSQPTDN